MALNVKGSVLTHKSLFTPFFLVRASRARTVAAWPPMAAGKSHLEIFKDALQDPEVPADPILTLEAPSVMLRIRWVEQMPWIALSIGVEATRKELVPFLTSKVTETFNSDAFVEGLEDEVLTHLAVVLGDFADYVGGPSEAWCLLEPLFALCNTDETLVREAAVKSIIQLSEKIALEPKGPELLFKHMVKSTLDLFDDTVAPRQAGWFSSRVSAYGLVATAYKACAASAEKGVTATIEAPVYAKDDCKAPWTPDTTMEQIISLFTASDHRAEPMVRRAIAGNIEAFASAIGPEKTRTALVPLWMTLVGYASEVDTSIRVKALQCSKAIFQVLAFRESDLGTGSKNPTQTYLDCAADAKSWRVRVAVAESLPDVAMATGVGKRMPPPDPSYPPTTADEKLLQETFLSLLNDSEAEVKHASAKCAAAAAFVLGESYAVSELVDPLIKQVRLSLVGP